MDGEWVSVMRMVVDVDVSQEVGSAPDWLGLKVVDGYSVVEDVVVGEGNGEMGFRLEWV